MIEKIDLKYRNDLLKKHIYLGLIISSSLFLYISTFDTLISVFMLIYFLILLFLVFLSKNESNYNLSSRIFAFSLTSIFIIGLILYKENRGEFYLILTYPIAVFSVRGYKEGMVFSIILSVVITLIYLFQAKFTLLEFIFLMVSFWMISYLLYTYRYFEFRNINEMKDIQKRKNQLLLQQSKLVNMGELVGAITHQWRQPLSEISSNILRVQVETEYKDAIDKNILKESVENTNRLLTHMSSILDTFKAVYEIEEKREKFLVNHAIRDAIVIYRCVILGVDIKLHFDGDKISHKFKIFGLKDEIVNIMIILFKNSLDAFIDKSIDNRLIEVEIKDQNDYIKIIYKDNAGGISLDIFDKLFEQKKSSKTNGMGIGLYIAKKIIEDRYLGSIKANNIKNGACFTIRLKKDFND